MKTLFFVLLPFVGFSQVLTNDSKFLIANYHFAVVDDAPVVSKGTIAVDKNAMTCLMSSPKKVRLFTGLRRMPAREGVMYAGINEGEVFFITLLDGGFAISEDYAGGAAQLYLYTTGGN